MAAVFVVCSRQPLLRHYSRPALGAPQKRRVTIAGSLPLNRTNLPFSRVRKGGRALLHPFPFLVRFQPSVLRTYVRRRCYLVEHNVRDGRQGGLVLISLFLSYFFLSLSVCLVMMGMIVRGPEWNRFFWRLAIHCHEQWKEPPEKRNVCLRNRLFRDSCGHSKGTWNEPRKRTCNALPSVALRELTLWRDIHDVYSLIERNHSICVVPYIFVDNVE